ncbi:MAG: pantoate--beta-alanine ligase [Ignavibacteria bacterium]
MKTVSSVEEIQNLSQKLKREGKTIGFVPTMGYLHEGHLSLLKECKAKADVTIVSIFINPAQFAPNEDFNIYPRDIERDKKLLLEHKADYLFLPDEKDIYQEGFQSNIVVNRITKILEGELRPEHFKGVTTIVAILFNCINPDYAFFGQKDAQQTAVIKQMVYDFKYGIEIIECPIVREKDGLALSSRNIYLTGEERKKALLLFKSLNETRQMIETGERDAKKIIKNIGALFLVEKNIHLNYVSIVDEKFNVIERLEEGIWYYVVIAAKIGKTRLIDNIKIKI